MSWTHKDTTKTGAYISNIQHTEREKNSHFPVKINYVYCLFFVLLHTVEVLFFLHLLVRVFVIVFCAVLLLILQFLTSFYSSIFSCVLNCVPFILRLCIYIVFFLHCSSCFVAFRKCVVMCCSVYLCYFVVLYVVLLLLYVVWLLLVCLVFLYILPTNIFYNKVLVFSW